MGTTGSRLKKIRKSIRRFSLSKSKENLSRSDQTRRSISLMNLSVLKKNILSKRKSRSTSLVIEPCRNDLINSEDTNEVFTTSTEKLESESKENLQMQKDLEVGDKKLDKDITVSDSHSEKNMCEGINQIAIHDEKQESKKNDSAIEANSENSQDINRDKPDVLQNIQECSDHKVLKKIEDKLNDIEKMIEQMNHDDLLLHLPLLKDEIHFLWIQSYDVEVPNEDVCSKRIQTIEYTKKMLHKLYSKAFKQHDYCTLRNKR